MIPSNTPEDNSSQREPLLSDAKFAEFQNYRKSAENVRDFYENLITSGELRVVKKVTFDPDGICSGCGEYDAEATHTREWEVWEYCHYCGGKTYRVPQLHITE